MYLIWDALLLFLAFVWSAARQGMTTLFQGEHVTTLSRCLQDEHIMSQLCRNLFRIQVAAWHT
jgi:hypothetical protein